MSKLIILLAFCSAIHKAASVAIYGQCGGIGYSGDTTCDSGTCQVINSYYSQCLPASGGSVPTTSTSGTTPTSTASVLNAKFVSHGKKFWGAVYNANITKSNILKEIGAISINSFKWSATESTRGVFTFSGADSLVNWAVSGGKMIRAQPLVWYSQIPSWVSSINDKTTLTSVIQNHISNVAMHYKGKFYSWYIFNEIMNEDGSLRSNVFYNVLGESFVTVAFQAARNADSTARRAFPRNVDLSLSDSLRLYINDYNLDSNNAKVQGLVSLVKRVNSVSRLIDGIGTECHLNSGGAGGVQEALTALASAGTEACLAMSACVSITSLTDKLFDYSGKPTDVYNAVLAVL